MQQRYFYYGAILDTLDTFPNEITGFKNSKIWNLLYDF